MWFCPEKSRYQTASPKGIRENGVFPWKNVFGKSVCMAGIWRSRRAPVDGENLLPVKKERSLFLFPGRKGKQVIGFETGSSCAAASDFVFLTGNARIFRVFLKRKADTCAYTVVSPERQKGELSLYKGRIRHGKFPLFRKPPGG